MMYTVTANDTPTHYGSDYFPRNFKYKTEAQKCAERVTIAGASVAFIKCPNGQVLRYVRGRLVR